MTKNIKLISDYKLPNNMKCIGGYDFFNYTRPSLQVGEFYKPNEIVIDPNNVPIYDSKECTNVIRTVAIECYGCHCNDESIEVPTIKADEFLAMQFLVPDPDDSNKKVIKNIFEEVS